jgi:thiol-disulfide isomerase/thioredoxin
MAALALLGSAAWAQGIGQEAPDFRLPTLDGEIVALADLRGAPVLLNFWATWCPPCREELPLFQEVAEASPDLQVFLINAGESREQAARYFEAVGLDMQTAVNPTNDRPEDTEDSLSVAQRYRVRGMPTTFFLDADGIVRSLYIGEITPAVLSERLAEIGVTWQP